MVLALSRPYARFRGVVGFNDTCVSCFTRLLVRAPGLSVPMSNFARHGGFQRHFQLFTSIFHGVLELHVIRIDLVSASQLASMAELRLFNSPMLLFLSLSCFRHVGPCI